MSTVAVTGLGAVTPLGRDVDSTWRALLDGQTAVRHWPDLAGHALDLACRIDERVWRPPPGHDTSSRGRDLAVQAAGEALTQAGLLTRDSLVVGTGVGTVDPARVGCFVGTTMGESAVFETAAQQGAFDLDEGGGHVFARTIQQRFGLGGPVVTFGTACAAGNYAIGAAARAVASGRVDVAVAGGVEPFSQIAMVGFARMRAMDPTGCAPFGLGRRGMTLGEGAAFLVLSRMEDAQADGIPVLATIGGLGLAADAHHPTAPREDGSQMAAAMLAGLQRAGVCPDEVGWISAHGTGTTRSDAAEALAIRTVFGQGRVPPVSSIKGAIGHSLGAATAVEAVASVRALGTQVLPPNAGVTDIDPSLELDVPLAARPSHDLHWVMSCGYAFGGLNSALLIGRAA